MRATTNSFKRRARFLNGHIIILLRYDSAVYDNADIITIEQRAHHRDVLREFSHRYLMDDTTTVKYVREYCKAYRRAIAMVDQQEEAYAGEDTIGSRKSQRRSNRRSGKGVLR